MRRLSWPLMLLLSANVLGVRAQCQEAQDLDANEFSVQTAAVVSGERIPVVLRKEDRFPGTELYRRVLRYEHTNACELTVWAESAELDCVLRFEKLGSSFRDEKPGVAGRTPALFHLRENSASAWEFTIEAESTGTVTFQLTECAVLEGLLAASQQAEQALQEVQRLRLAGERVESAELRRAAVDELVRAGGESRHSAYWKPLMNLANEALYLRDGPRRKAEWTRLLALLGPLMPSRSFQLANARLNLAYAFEDLHEFAKEEPLLLAAIDALEATESQPGRMLRSAQLMLGMCYARQRKYVAAQRELERYLWKYESILGPEHVDVLRPKNTLGIVLMQLGDLDGAERMCRQWLAIYPEKYPADTFSITSVRGNLANILAMRGRLVEARELQEKVAATLRRLLGPDHEGAIRAEANLARTRSKLDESAAAVQSLEEVLATRVERLSETHPEVQDTRAALAEALQRCGEQDRAFELYQLVLEQRARLYPPGHPHLMMSQDVIAGYLAWADRDEELRELGMAYAEGIRTNARGALALSWRERTTAVRRAAGRIDNVIRWLGEVDPDGFSEIVLELIERHRILSGRVPRSIGEDLADAELSALRERVLACHARASELASAAAGDGSVSAVELGIAFTDRDAAQRAYREELVERGLWYLEEVPLSMIAGALPPDSLAVSYWRMGKGGSSPLEPGESGGRGDFCAQLLSPDGSIEFVSLAPAEEVAEAGRRWRAALGAPLSEGDAPVHSGQTRAAGEALRELILDPVLERAADREQIYICLDDILHLLPLDALPLGDGHVGDRYQVRNLGFLSELVQSTSSTGASPSLLAVGGIDYGEDESEAIPRPAKAAGADRGELFEGQFPALKNTREEIEGISSLFARRFDREALLLTGAEATRAAFRKHAPGTRFLHLATHGAFADEHHRAWAADTDAGWLVERMAPLSLCGLAFAGANEGPGADGTLRGILTGEELAGLDLSSCEFAVLSACDSSVGLRTHGLGLWSLQNALRTAGTRVTLTSLWPVHDDRAARLMVEFYTRLWGPKQESPTEALWNAKRALRQKRTPLQDWAGWVLCGDVGAVE